MVRIKERYLLVNIIYPPERSRPSAGLPACVVYHQPTSSTLTPGALLKGLRAEVATLFGDYGSGSIESGLSSTPRLPRTPSTVRRMQLTPVLSQIPISRHVDVHPPCLEGPPPAGLGRPHVYEPRAEPGRQGRKTLRIQGRQSERHHPQGRRRGHP